MLCIFNFLVSFFKFYFEPGGIGPWPGWVTIVLQCYDTGGWIVWCIKLSPKWPIHCVKWDVKPYYAIWYHQLYCLCDRTGMHTCGQCKLTKSGSRRWSFCVWTVLPPAYAGLHWRTNLPSAAVQGWSRCATLKRRTTGGLASRSRNRFARPSHGKLNMDHHKIQWQNVLLRVLLLRVLGT